VHGPARTPNRSVRRPESPRHWQVRAVFGRRANSFRLRSGEVRAEREAERETRRATTAAHAVRDLLARSAAPMSRRDIRGELGGTDATVRAAVAALLADADSGVVEVEPRMHGAYRVWVRERAIAAGLPIRVLEAP
jgi:hypothetical protein